MMNYIYVFHAKFIGAEFPGMFRQKYCDICVIPSHVHQWQNLFVLSRLSFHVMQLD